MSMQFLEKISDLAAMLTRVIVVFLMSVTMLSLMLQVFSRYVMGEAFSWTDEMAMFGFCWLVFLAGSLGVKESFHVSLDLLKSFLSVKAAAIFNYIIALLILIFGIFFFLSGYQYVDRTLGQLSAAVRYPIVWLHLAAPVTGILIIVHSIPKLSRKSLAVKDNREVTP